VKSVIYDQSLRYIKVLMWVLALWIFFRGHNAPGGGFAAALIASLAKILEELSSSHVEKNISRLLKVMGIGILLSFVGLLIRNMMVFDGGVFFLVFASIVLMFEFLLQKNLLKTSGGKQ
jgi:multicomponent Na+:H+ antiporter subunit A